MARSAAKSALATPPTTMLDELATAGIVVPDDADDGLGEASGEDLKIASKVFNMKGVGPDGRQIPADAFYDTVDETVVDTLDAVLLYLHKTNVYSWYDNAENRTKVECRSWDRVTGTMADGTTRPCAGCPDDQWYTEDGKRRKNCGPVYNVAGVDRATQMPFWMRFKRTSLPIFKQHMQRHHLKRRIVNGTRSNYPLYSFAVKLSCVMSDDGKYALPVIERGAVLEQAEFDQCRESAAAIRENVIPLLTASDAQADAATGGGGDPDTSFDPSTFGGADGGGDEKDFVE